MDSAPDRALALAQLVTYLSAAPKSNALYEAYTRVQKDIKSGAADSVPLHLRNAPTELMKSLHYGSEYKYSHDFPGHFVEQQYLPDSLKDAIFYRPSDQGAERTILERLNAWWTRRRRV